MALNGDDELKAEQGSAPWCEGYHIRSCSDGEQRREKHDNLRFHQLINQHLDFPFSCDAVKRPLTSSRRVLAIMIRRRDVEHGKASRRRSIASSPITASEGRLTAAFPIVSSAKAAWSGLTVSPSAR